MQVGKTSDDWKNDVEGKPESAASKVVRSAVQAVSKITKKTAAQSGLLSENQLAAVEAVANAAENQAAADPNTSLKERAKMGGTVVATIMTNVWCQIMEAHNCAARGYHREISL